MRVARHLIRPLTRVGAVWLALLVVGACGGPGAMRQSADEPAIQVGLLQLDDLPTHAPFGAWESVDLDDAADPDTSTTESEEVEDPNMPACADLAQVDPALEEGLLESAASPTFATDTEDTTTTIGVLARNTVYQYETAAAAETGFESVDSDLFAACIAENVTPGTEESVASDVGELAAPAVGDESVAFSADLSDYTYYGGNDNSTVSELVAVRVGSAVVVFQFVSSGQYFDDFDDERTGPELETVTTVVDRLA
ncbi:MAG: hypothetical protein IT198_10715 [Acidimicrobiia bacterium]|nr:hypothetical protein [Acidimicrobiia bacterium]